MNTLKSIPVFTLALMLACSNTKSPENSNADSTSTSVDNEPAGGEAALTEYAKTLPLDKIKLPAGFTIDVFAEVENARSMALSPSGVLYVGNKDKDNVYAVKDTDGDFKADKKWVLASWPEHAQRCGIQRRRFIHCRGKQNFKDTRSRIQVGKSPSAYNCKRRLSERDPSWLEIYRIWS